MKLKSRKELIRVKKSMYILPSTEKTIRTLCYKTQLNQGQLIDYAVANINQESLIQKVKEIGVV